VVQMHGERVSNAAVRHAWNAEDIGEAPALLGCRTRRRGTL
jgi:FAD synthase